MSNVLLQQISAWRNVQNVISSVVSAVTMNLPVLIILTSTGYLSRYPISLYEDHNRLNKQLSFNYRLTHCLRPEITTPSNFCHPFLNRQTFKEETTHLPRACRNHENGPATTSLSPQQPHLLSWPLKLSLSPGARRQLPITHQRPSITGEQPPRRNHQ